jgi:hypothetical protein
MPGNSMDGLLFLFDNTIDLRYIEDESQIVRAVHVAKMRSRAHSMSLNSLTITDRGLEVGHALDRVTGRLGWSALRTQGPAEPARPAAPAADAWPTGPEAPGHRARVASPRGAGQE